LELLHRHRNSKTQATAPDLVRNCRLRRIKAEIALGESFALRASVAYKGAWIRLTRRFPARW
jgi:hypothetical protein